MKKAFISQLLILGTCISIFMTPFFGFKAPSSIEFSKKTMKSQFNNVSPAAINHIGGAKQVNTDRISVTNQLSYSGNTLDCYGYEMFETGHYYSYHGNLTTEKIADYAVYYQRRISNETKVVATNQGGNHFNSISVNVKQGSSEITSDNSVFSAGMKLAYVYESSVSLFFEHSNEVGVGNEYDVEFVFPNSSSITTYYMCVNETIYEIIILYYDSGARGDWYDIWSNSLIWTDDRTVKPYVFDTMICKEYFIR